MSQGESNIYRTEERLYNFEDLGDDEGNILVPLENLISAASYVVAVINSARIPCGIMGGLAVALNGISRETRDVDIGVISRNWLAIRGALEQHLDSGRLKIPRSKLVADHLRIFCRTGTPWDTCRTQHEIEVDLISKPNFGEEVDYRHNPPVFTLPTLFRFKLLAYCNREARRDLDDMDAILRKATPKAILQSRDSFRNMGVGPEVIEGIDEEYVELRQLLFELLQ